MSAPKPVTPRQPGRARPRRGFALIIVISLLALLIMVLVSLATLTRIEAGVGANSLKQAQAQQNARFALELAIGELQRHAGPDQRVTATAAILPAPLQPANGLKRWSGVWNADAAGGPRTWLVSGSEQYDTGTFPSLNSVSLETLTNSASPLVRYTATGIDGAGEMVLLVGRNSVGGVAAEVPNYAVAPLVPLRATTNEGEVDTIVGRYAWWVGDEGVKARVNLVDPHVGAPADSYEGRIRHQVAQRVGGQFALDDLPGDNAQLDRVLTSNQIPFTGPTLADTRSRFHDVTTFSRGVLADAANGGLKYDLSPFLAGASSTAIPDLGAKFASDEMTITYGDLQHWASIGWEANQSGAGFDAVADANESVHPIITRYSLFFGASREATDQTRIRLHFMPVIAIWNPHSVSLRGNFQVEVAIPFRFTFSGDATGVPFVLPGGITRMSTGQVNILPGECRLFAAAGWSAASSEASENLLGGTWSTTRAFYWDDVAVDLTPDEFNEVGVTQDATSGSESFAVRLRLGTASDAAILHQISGPGTFPSYRGQPSDLGGGATPTVTLPVTSAGASGPGTSLMHARMVGHGWRLLRTNEVLWDPISHETALPGDPLINADGVTPGYQRLLVGWDWRPTMGGIPFSVLYDAPHRDLDAASEPTTLFPLSLVALQHVRGRSPVWEPRLLFDRSPSVGGAPPEFGSGLWDRFTLTGITSWDETVSVVGGPSRRLRAVFRDGRPVDPLVVNTDPVIRTSAHLLVDGAFNINSTSAAAWAAVLGSLALDAPDAIDVEIGAGEAEPLNHPHPMPRMAFPRREALQTGNPGDTPSSQEAWGGYRRLTETQRAALATQIATRVRTRLSTNGPFRSLAEFVEERIVEAAIGAHDTALGAGHPNRINLDTLVWPNIARGTRGATIPGVLTQWDVLNAIFPALTVRSDTFLIRTYGESVNPVTGETEARAWCEAVVQRMPEYVDPDNAPWDRGGELTETNDQFGRRFQIVYFRWLTPADI